MVWTDSCKEPCVDWFTQVCLCGLIHSKSLVWTDSHKEPCVDWLTQRVLCGLIHSTKGLVWTDSLRVFCGLIHSKSLVWTDFTQRALCGLIHSKSLVWTDSLKEPPPTLYAQLSINVFKLIFIIPYNQSSYLENHHIFQSYRCMIQYFFPLSYKQVI
jgi:hypothetical protein